MTSGGTVTILFTDLVGSTELLSEAGDEEGRAIFNSHRDLLRDAVTAHGGREVKWLGDGLMVAFTSAAEAIRSAVAMQQGAQGSSRALPIRVGLNTGDALEDDESDLFGASVVVAKRLCDSADAGQILCSDIVAALLRGRKGFDFSDIGDRELKGIPGQVRVFEVRYETASPTARLARTPFVGRRTELDRLEQRMKEAMDGRGGVVLLAGEPGIGKTRTAEELAALARERGCEVTWGRCVDGDWAPPYGPFAEAVDGIARISDPHQLREDVAMSAEVLASIAPTLRTVVGDAAAAPIPAGEERYRVFDAVSRFFMARAARAPLLVMLDDLHWADSASVALLRHVARFAASERVLLVGTYRDTDVRATHPLTEALSQLRRETTYDRIRLDGLAADAVGELLSTLAEHDIPQELVDVIASETGGNPFFIHEVLLHLIEERKIYRGEDGRWTSDIAINEIGIPEGVREVVGRRVSRLSPDASTLLTVASAFDGDFRFDVLLAVSRLDDRLALDALDEALDAQIVVPREGGDTYAFSHPLIRHTLYGELNPSRQVRLHRDLAEALQSAIGADASAALHGEVAKQYQLSSILPGADRGADHALAAATQAEETGAYDEAVALLRLAIELLGEQHERVPEVLARLGIALAWATDFDAAASVSIEAGHRLAASAGPEVAAARLRVAMQSILGAGSFAKGALVAEVGLAYAGDRKGLDWAVMTVVDLGRREIADPDFPGVPMDTPAKREASHILRAAGFNDENDQLNELVYESRDDVLKDQSHAQGSSLHLGGLLLDYHRHSEERARDMEAQGRLAQAVASWAGDSRCLTALGRLSESREALAKALAIDARLPTPSNAINLLAARDELAMAVDDGWGELMAEFGIEIDTKDPAVPFHEALVLEPMNRQILAAGLAAMARMYARLQRSDAVTPFIELLVPALEKAPAWANNYTRIACDSAEALWFSGRTDYLDVIERALREKVVAPDFRYPMHDGRQSLARLCALTERYDEAIEWFADSRRVLAEMESLPMIAICDHDEAVTLTRRNGRGDAARATELLDRAVEQFRDLGMTGWIARAAKLV